MNCPVCGEAMEPGFLQGSGGSLCWVRKQDRLIPRRGQGEFFLPRFVAGFTGLGDKFYYHAFLCRRCGKILIDINDGPEKEPVSNSL